MEILKRKSSYLNSTLAAFVWRPDCEMMMLQRLMIQSLLQKNGSLILINVKEFRWVFVVISLNAVRYLRVYTWVGEARQQKKRSKRGKQTNKQLRAAKNGVVGGGCKKWKKKRKWECVSSFRIDAVCMIIKLCKINVYITGSVVIGSSNFKY